MSTATLPPGPRLAMHDHVRLVRRRDAEHLTLYELLNLAYRYGHDDAAAPLQVRIRELEARLRQYE